MRDWTAHVPIAVLWLAWLAYWAIAARDAKPLERQEPIASRLTHVIPLTIAAFLLAWTSVPFAALDDRFLPPAPAIQWLGTAMVAAGLAFMAWARVHLGGNWSGWVALKQSHELIRSGPYGVVRHPIYSGLLLAILGTAIAFGRLRDVLAFVLMAVAVWRKAGLEESYLMGIFPDSYARYRSEVPGLFPSILPRRPRSGSS